MPILQIQKLSHLKKVERSQSRAVVQPKRPTCRDNINIIISTVATENFSKLLMNIWPCRERFTERFTCWSCRLHGRKSSRHETTRGQKSTQRYTRCKSTRTTTQHWVRTAHQSLRTAVRNHKQTWLIAVFFPFISLKNKISKTWALTKPSPPRWWSWALRS